MAFLFTFFDTDLDPNVASSLCDVMLVVARNVSCLRTTDQTVANPPSRDVRTGVFVSQFRVGRHHERTLVTIEHVVIFL